MKTQPKIGPPFHGDKPRTTISLGVAAETKDTLTKWAGKVRKPPGVVTDQLVSHAKKTKFKPKTE